MPPYQFGKSVLEKRSPVSYQNWMKRLVTILMLATALGVLGCSTQTDMPESADQAAFAQASKVDWQEVFSDSGTGDWNENWFLDSRDAQEKIEAWRIDYNANRPQRALGGKTPDEALQSFEREGQFT